MSEYRAVDFDGNPLDMGDRIVGLMSIAKRSSTTGRKLGHSAARLAFGKVKGIRANSVDVKWDGTDETYLVRSNRVYIVQKNKQVKQEAEVRLDYDDALKSVVKDRLTTIEQIGQNEDVDVYERREYELEKDFLWDVDFQIDMSNNLKDLAKALDSKSWTWLSEEVRCRAFENRCSTVSEEKSWQKLHYRMDTV